MATRTDQILACRADKPHGLGHVLPIFSPRRVACGPPAGRPLATAKIDRTRLDRADEWCLAPARSLTQAGPRPDAQPTPVVGGADGVRLFQPDPPCMAGRRLKSRMLDAVTVLPLTVAVTAT